MTMINILLPQHLITQIARVFTARLAKANLVAKTDFDNKLRSLNQKLNSKHLLVEKELKKLQTFDSIYFRGKSDFEEDGTQNYLVFQSMYRYFKRVVNSEYVLQWKLHLTTFLIQN